MVRARCRALSARLRAEIRQALLEKHTPREVAGSFALGTFITMLPTLGTGLLLFFGIVAVTERVSKIALFASVVVFNPVVKWGVYASSFTLGVALLGPVEGVSRSEVSVTAGPDIVVRLLLGNLILAAIATAVGYVVAYRIAIRLEKGEVGEALEEAVDDFVDDVLTE
ncbi:DUF2062 domain-containing protein [Halovivax sp.]|uniref:DUF2062 domain-containing protein n=1 Tax=Halovivax sp. TaxID=1935978 RepID=UPI0025BEC7F4|nr:DUF2062 domain-containing protein [Halovivax sp.]